jgi:Magnesium chelatase, subunit ChlI C-terminal
MVDYENSMVTDWVIKYVDPETSTSSRRYTTVRFSKAVSKLVAFCEADMRVGYGNFISCKRIVTTAMSQLNLSARAYDRTPSVRLARTMADSVGCEEIPIVHRAETLQYRLKLMKYE